MHYYNQNKQRMWILVNPGKSFREGPFYVQITITNPTNVYV